MKYLPDYLINVFNHFLGYGSIESRIICFGIEEHGNSNEVSEREDLRIDDYVNKFESMKDNREFFTMNENDFITLFREYPEQRKIDEDNSKKSILYRYCKLIDNKLGNKLPTVCNLYPLWKNTTKNQNYDPITLTKFGVDNFNTWYDRHYCKVRKLVLLKYFEHLISIKDEFKIFTFGESKTFITLFNDILEKAIVNVDNPQFFSSKGKNMKYWKIHYKNLNIYILYHPSYKWINKIQINELLDSL
jgi:hypothetical protein